MDWSRVDFVVVGVTYRKYVVEQEFKSLVHFHLDYPLAYTYIQRARNNEKYWELNCFIFNVFSW